MQAGLQACASVCTLEAESVDRKNVIISQQLNS